MVFHERAAWASLVATVFALTAYVVAVLVQADGGDVATVNWVPLMFGAIAEGILLAVLTILVWGVIVARRDRDAASASDIRDRDIEQMSGNVEASFLVIAGLGVIVLCALGADVFWIANTMFAGFAVAGIVGGIARVVAYRKGLV